MELHEMIEMLSLMRAYHNHYYVNYHAPPTQLMISINLLLLQLPIDTIILMMILRRIDGLGGCTRVVCM